MGAKFFLIFLIVGTQVFASEKLSLSERLESLIPFHKTIYEPVPTKICQTRKKSKICKKISISQDNPKKHFDLINEIEEKFIRNSNKNELAQFNQSELGKNYNQLKRFLDIYSSLKSCSEDKVLWANDKLKNILQRYETNTSLSEIESTCREVKNSKKENLDSYAFDILSIIENYQTKNSPKEALFNQMISEGIDKSMEGFLGFHLKFKEKLPSKDETLVNLCNGMKAKSYSSSRGKKSRFVKSDLCTEDEKIVLGNIYDFHTEKLKKLKILTHKTKKISEFEKCKSKTNARGRSSTFCQYVSQYDFLKSPEKMATSSEIDVMDSKSSVADLNNKILQMQNVLFNYDKDKIKIEKEFSKKRKVKTKGKSDRYKGRVNSRLSRQKLDALKRIKKEHLESFRKVYAILHASGAGDLLQTRTIRKEAGIDNLEAMVGKFFGLGGFNTAALESIEPFPKLNLVDDKIVDKAINESFGRLKTQVKDLLFQKRKKYSQSKLQENGQLSQEDYDEFLLDNVKDLTQKMPGITGKVLINNPELSGELCHVAKELAKDQRNEEILETGTYIVLGGGIAIAGIATLGGSLPVSAMIAATGAGVAFTAGDYMYQSSLADEHYKKSQKILNAYLSGVGDSKSIDQIREEWNQYLEADYTAATTLGFGLFDIMGIPSAARAGAFVRLTNTFDNIDHALSINRKLINYIAHNDEYIKAVRKLIEIYPKDEIGNMLSLLAILPKEKQKNILELLSKAAQNEILTPGIVLSALRLEKGLGDDFEAGISELEYSLTLYGDRYLGLSSKKKADYLTDESFSPYFIGQSEDTANELFEAITFLEVRGKTKKQIADILQEYLNECKI